MGDFRHIPEKDVVNSCKEYTEEYNYNLRKTITAFELHIP
jgi:hypothetical protein